MDGTHPRAENKDDGEYVTPPTVVVYGGSFDPPHMAHAMAVLYALSTLPKARILIVPTFQHALGKELCASFDDRLQMAKLAMVDLPRTEVSDIERTLGGTSRTLDTLQALQQRHPNTSWRLLIGADILAERDSWFRFDEVQRLAPPLVIGRPGFVSDAPFTLPDITSRSLRDELAEGSRPVGRVATRVLDWIDQHQLYRRGEREHG